MNINWELVMFGSIWIGLFVVLPICVYLALRYLLSGQTRYWVIKVAGIAGVLFALYLMAVPTLYPPTDSGGLGIIFLIPLGALLGLVCAGLLWINGRHKRAK